MTINRIFCIGKNYAEHIRELGGTPDEAFVVFMKPASCIVPEGEPIQLPRNQGAVHHEAEMVVRLSGGGRAVEAQDALSHVSHFALGIDLTLRELQGKLKAKGAPWELAKSFDGAAPLGAWTAYGGQNLQKLEFTCRVNGALRQHAKTADMLFAVTRCIEILSRSWALMADDIIYTGTPAGVGPLVSGDEIKLEGAGFASCGWRCK